jgi:hypothetical protein
LLRRTDVRQTERLYLLLILGDVFSQFVVRAQLIVSGDAAATAGNIIAAPTFYRAGLTAEIVMLCCDIAVAVIFYNLFQPVSRGLAQLALVFSVAAEAVHAAALTYQVAPRGIVPRPR